MSSWARAWAYEQSVGERVDGKWRKNPGAKAVLAAICEFPDQDGKCYVGQATLARMTDMSERTVRTHLHFLEHTAKLIRRTQRRRPDGTRTSDYIWVLAPKERLRPPERAPEPQPEESAAGDNQPEDFARSTGRFCTANRKISPDQPEESAGHDPLVEPSVDPLEEPVVVGKTQAESPVADDTTATCLKILLSVKGFPRDQAENAIKLAEYREEFPAADPIEVCRDFKAFIDERPFKSGDKPRLRLRNFFKQANKTRTNGSSRPATRGLDRSGPTPETKGSLGETSGQRAARQLQEMGISQDAPDLDEVRRRYEEQVW